MSADLNEGEVRSPYRNDADPAVPPRATAPDNNLPTAAHQAQQAQQQATAGLQAQPTSSAAGQPHTHLRKKQKTEHSASAAGREDRQAPRDASQQQARAPPPDRSSVTAPSQATAGLHQQQQQPSVGVPTELQDLTQQQQLFNQSASMPPPRPSIGAAARQKGQGIEAAASTVAPLPEWELERLRIKQQRQEEKMRLK